MNDPVPTRYMKKPLPKIPSKYAFDILTDDKLYEICETLDDVSLADFSRTSKRVQDVCQGELTKRKQERDSLLSKLIGGWIICVNGNMKFLSIEQSKGDPKILIIKMDGGNDEPLVDYMWKDFGQDFQTGEIGKSIENLNLLYSNVLNRKYKKLERYWGLYKDGGTYFFDRKYALIRLNPKPVFTGKYAAKEHLLKFAKNLKIKVTGKELPEKLRDLIIKELTKHNQMFSC